MKVGYLIASVSRQGSGVFHVVRNLAINTQQLGHEVTVFGTKDEFTEEDLPAWGTVPVRAHPVVGPRGFGFSPGLVPSVENSGVDVLHVHGLWMYPSRASLKVSRSQHIPYLISPHGMLDPWALGQSVWKKKLATGLYEGAHLRGSACLVALCEAEAGSMRALGLRNPIGIIPSGQDLPPEPAVHRRSKGSGLAPGRKVLLFLGRLHPKKGLPALLRAWAACRNTEAEAAHWALVVAGAEENGHERELRRLVAELSLEESVLFTGPLFAEKKDRAFERAEAFVLPSLSEGLPVSVLEAWAWRLPVLMTPQCNLPEGFAAGAAISADPNVESLSSGLAALLQMGDSQREQMGALGRRLVEEKFSWRRAAEQTVSVYRWVCHAAPKPDCVQQASEA